MNKIDKHIQGIPHLQRNFTFLKGLRHYLSSTFSNFFFFQFLCLELLI